MEKQIISKFFALPKTKTAWWSFGLGLFFLLGVLAFILVIAEPNIIEHILGEDENGYYLMAILISIVFVELIVFLLNMKMSSKTYKSGERSWVAFVGYSPYILMGFFISAFIIFQLIIFLFYQ